MQYSLYKHMFKLDPAKPISAINIERLCTSGTDGIIIGGTDNITYENTKSLYDQLCHYAVPIYQEVSHADAILPNCDGYFIPFVLNANDPYWLLQAHQQAVKQFGRWIPWEKCHMEGYIILNPDSKAAKLTKANTLLTYEDIVSYVQLADKLLKLPYIYIEYSGMYGDPALMRKVKSACQHASLIYGGGIDSKDKAKEMGLFAHTIVVGNIIYENIDQALETVVR